MLVRSKSDFQALLRTTNDTELSMFSAQFEQIQNTILANYFGMEFINALDARLNATNPIPALHADEIFVIGQLKNAIVYLGFDLASARLLANVKSTGIEQSGGKSLYEWQQLIIENDSLENGYNAINAAIMYLYTKRDNTLFTLWKNSVAEQNARKYLFNKTADFQECVQIAHSTRTFEALKPSIKEALIKYIEPITGATLLAEITTKNIDFSIDGTKRVAMNLIKEALAQFTLGIAIYKLELKFNEQGARVVSISSSSGGKAKTFTPADMETKDRISERFVSTGNLYLEKLKTYLLDNNLITATTYTPIDNSKGSCVVL